MRAISAVIIFFIPTLVNVVFGMISNFNEVAKDDWEVCRMCITSPNGECEQYAEEAWK